MNLLHDAYTALLSGLTTKTNNEIHWENKMGNPITVEPVDIENCKYIVRRYYKNGNKEWEAEYQDGELHGKVICWDGNGNKEWEAEFQDGKRHGKLIDWYENGNKEWEAEWQNDKLHGKVIDYYENGNKRREAEYQDGELIKERLYKQKNRLIKWFKEIIK